eukprot:7603509-Lingulodinium_polyedra.AAC.1
MLRVASINICRESPATVGELLSDFQRRVRVPHVMCVQECMSWPPGLQAPGYRVVHAHEGRAAVLVPQGMLCDFEELQTSEYVTAVRVSRVAVCSVYLPDASRGLDVFGLASAQLWDLVRKCKRVRLPIVIAGDFNTVLCPNDFGI